MRALAMTSPMEDDKRRSPFTTTTDGLLTFRYRVVAEIWTGDMSKGSAALASNTISSEDMPLSRLGSSTLVWVMHGTWHLVGIALIFQGQQGKQRNGDKGTVWT